VSQLSEAMLLKMVKQGATVIIPGSPSKVRKKKSLRQSFSDELRNRRRKPLRLNTTIIPSPKPG